MHWSVVYECTYGTCNRYIPRCYAIYFERNNTKNKRAHQYGCRDLYAVIIIITTINARSLFRLWVRLLISLTSFDRQLRLPSQLLQQHRITSREVLLAFSISSVSSQRSLIFYYVININQNNRSSLVDRRSCLCGTVPIKRHGPCLHRQQLTAIEQLTLFGPAENRTVLAIKTTAI